MGLFSLGSGFATRNSCPTCGGLVFGGELGLHDSHTIYAGSLDDPSLFKPIVPRADGGSGTTTKPKQGKNDWLRQAFAARR